MIIIERLKKGIVLLLVVTLMSQIAPTYVYAKTTSEKLKDAQKEKEEAESKLSETTGKISDLKDTKAQLQSQLSNLNQNLTNVSNKLADLESRATDKKAQIEVTSSELDTAIEEENTQYELMKTRIRYVYEKGEKSLGELFMGSANLGAFLNHAEYIEKVNDYDQKMLQKLKEMKEATQTKKAQLEQEEQELEQLQADAAEEQKKVQGMVDETSSCISAYSGEISSAEKEALAAEATINAKKNDIATLQAQLEKEREIARRAKKMRKKDLSEISIDVSDRELLACLIQCEADGEPWEGKIAVGSVVLNRARSGVYPDTIVGVVYQSGQFAPVASGRLAMRLAAGANSTCLSAADEVLGGANNIGDCLFFRTIIPGIDGTIIGNHIFY